MGRRYKKIISFIAAIMIAGLPMSVSLAAVDCLFHETVEVDAQPYAHDHGGFQLDISDLSDIGVQHVDDNSEQADNQADNGCATSLMVVSASDSELFVAESWGADPLVSQPERDLVDVTLPGEIRPPIQA